MWKSPICFICPSAHRLQTQARLNATHRRNTINRGKPNPQPETRPATGNPTHSPGLQPTAESQPTARDYKTPSRNHNPQPETQPAPGNPTHRGEHSRKPNPRPETQPTAENPTRTRKPNPQPEPQPTEGNTAENPTPGRKPNPQPPTASRNSPPRRQATFLPHLRGKGQVHPTARSKRPSRPTGHRFRRRPQPKVLSPDPNLEHARSDAYPPVQG